MKIFIDEEKLTDGSHVYNVRLTRFEDMPRSIDTLVFAAVDKGSAELMAEMFFSAIDIFSTEIITRDWDWH